MSSADGTPDRASVVIVGGGVIGLSTAYALVRAGVPDVVLLERDSLGAGSTSKAAGGVRAQFSDEINIRLGLRSIELFERFTADFGQEIDLQQTGYLFLLDNDDDVEAFAEQVALQNSLGVDSRMIAPDEAARLCPLVHTGDVVGAAYSPRDGHCTPESVVLGYATAARKLGARLLTGCAATGIAVRGDQIVGVNTARGTIATSTVICTAGAWSRQVGRWVDVELPIEPLQRQIVVTEPVPEDFLPVPFTIDFSSSFYFHAEGHGLLLGMAERRDRWGFDVSRSDQWLADLGEVIGRRAPQLADIGIAHGWAGLYEMTPDHNAVIGEVSDLSRFLYAAGFSGHGFLMGPAVGEVMRDLYLDRTPTIEVGALDVRRFAAMNARPERYIV